MFWCKRQKYVFKGVWQMVENHYRWDMLTCVELHIHFAKCFESQVHQGAYLCTGKTRRRRAAVAAMDRILVHSGIRKLYAKGLFTEPFLWKPFFATPCAGKNGFENTTLSGRIKAMTKSRLETNSTKKLASSNHQYPTQFQWEDPK